MLPPTSNIFDFPELVDLLGTFLLKGDPLSSWALAADSIHTVPAFYRNIGMCYKYRNLSKSSDAIRTLLRNSSIIRRIEMDKEFSVIYFEGVRNKQGQGNLAAGGAIEVVFQDSFRSSDQALHTDALATIHPHISELCLDELQITFGGSLNRLALTISGMRCLGSLTLYIKASGQHIDRIVPALYFICLQSVCYLSLDLTLQRPSQNQASSSEMTTDVEMEPAEKPPLERQSPLHQLTALHSMSEIPFSMDVFQLMLAHCPNAHTLEVPRLTGVTDPDLAAKVIVDACPRLRQLEQYDKSFDHGTTGSLMAAVAKAMPEDKLTTICFFRLDDSDDTFLFSLTRHFKSLTWAHLSEVMSVSSEALQTLLCMCSGLEVVQIATEHLYQAAIDLEDAVATKWATDRIVQLDLTVFILSYQWMSPKDAERTNMELLEKFYRQIGALIELSYLSLKIWVDEHEMKDDYEPVTYKDELFPGFLVLGDKDKTGAERGGYLDLLSELKKL
ncbi:hypothetical protein BGX23_006988 [Mortierella sp. AD031]|nr:hypothetical protein BGX23_006988 [Mortierella sp. AD031]